MIFGEYFYAVSLYEQVLIFVLRYFQVFVCIYIYMHLYVFVGI